MSEQGNKSSFRPNYFFWFGIIFLVGLVISIVIPNFCNDGRGGPVWKAGGCINNLRQLDAAANQFALERNKTNGDAINFPDDLTPYIKLNSKGKIPPCPSGGIYSIKKVGEKPTCSLSTLIPPHALQ